MTKWNREDAAAQGSHGDAAAASAADLGSTSAIGRKLKAFYDDVASEPVPDRFLNLLDALDRAEQSVKQTGREQGRP